LAEQSHSALVCLLLKNTGLARHLRAAGLAPVQVDMPGKVLVAELANRVCSLLTYANKLRRFPYENPRF